MVARRRRTPLSREAILDAALAVVDAEGLDALSMRRLARALGVEAMSLYNYFGSKDALVAALIDRVVGAVELPRADVGDWKAWVRELGLRMWKALAERKSLMPAVVSNATLGQEVLRIVDALFGRLQEAGHDEASQLLLWELLKNQVFGSLAQQSGAAPPPNISPGAFPHLQRAMAASCVVDACTSFEQGLDFLLEAFERQVAG